MKDSILQNVMISSGKFEKEKSYWMKKLSGELTICSFLFDNADFSNNTGSEPSGHQKHKEFFRISGEFYQRLLDISQHSEYGIFIILVTAVNCLIYKYTEENDIITGTSVLKQSKASFRFNDTLPLRNSLWGEVTFKNLLLQVKQIVNEAYENRKYPLDKILSEVDSASDIQDIRQLYQAFILLKNIHGNDEEVVKNQYCSTIFVFNMTEHFLECELHYHPGLTVDINTHHIPVKQLWQHLINFLQVTTREPMIRISGIDILDVDEKNKILYDFNHTAAQYPKNKPLHQLFEEQTCKTSDRIALEYKGYFLTYGELNKKSNQLAQFLERTGVEFNEIIGIMIKRSIEQIIGVFAVLKAGGAFLPLDPEYPQERLEFMVSDANIKIILTKDGRAERFSPVDSRTLVVDLSQYWDSRVGQHVGDIDIDKNNEIGGNTSDRPAYIIYTSGSTGRPKGVIGLHKGVQNRCHWMWQTFPFRTDDICCQKTSMNFVDSIWEIFGPLFKGIPSVIIPGETVTQLPKFVKELKKKQVTRIVMVPSLLKSLFDYDAVYYKELTRLKFWVVSGETLGTELLALFQKSMPDSILLNLYGSSEVSADAAFYNTYQERILKKRVPIGSPIHNLKIYILDKEGGPVPLCVAGEIYIGGDGLSPGYLNQQELTFEKFVPDIFNSPKEKDMKLFKSGDLGRYLTDGKIEFLGRLDHQVKIRGVRIECAEIENLLLNIKYIKEAVVIDKTDKNGEKYLCAYLVMGMNKEETGASAGPGPKKVEEKILEKIKTQLSRKLPGYMIPSYFVRLDKIPLTPNGKFDRKAFPEPATAAETGYITPSTEIEKKLVKMWCDILGIEKVSVTENFLISGGHSRNLVSLISQIYKEFEVEIPLGEMFYDSSLRGIATYIEQAIGVEEVEEVEKVRYLSINTVEKKEYYPLSSAQKRLYVIQQMDVESIAYNIPTMVPLDVDFLGVEVEKKKVDYMIHQLIHRHESFRTSFELIDEQPVQRIHYPVDLDFEIEYHNLKEKNEDSAIAIERIFSDLVRPFHLSQAPLLRAALLEIENKEYTLMMDMHHIIFDGVSFAVLIKDLVALCSENKLPVSSIQYKDFSEWQQNNMVKESINKQESFWLREFTGEIPVLDLPTDFTRPVVRDFAGSIIYFNISNNDTRALKAYALEEGTTLFTILLEIYTLFLSKISSREDIVVGIPTATRRQSELEDIIGMFVNTMVLRNFPAGEKSLKQFLGEMKARTLEAFENQDYPYEELVEKVEVKRDTSRNPLFDVMFILQNIDISAIEILELKLKPYSYDKGTSRFDLTLECINIGDVLECSFEYSTKLFKADTIERFIGYFKELISIVIENPQIKIADIEIITEEEKKQVIFDFNHMEFSYTQEKTVHEWVEEQTMRTPDNIAAVYENYHLSYSALLEKYNPLAWGLRGKGVEPDVIIGLMVERSLEMLIGILGILKAGGTYLPINPEYPEERISYMLEDSSAKILLSKTSKSNKVSEERKNTLLAKMSKKIEVIDLNKLNVDEYENLSNKYSQLNQPTQLCYVIYTSGTTGKPKGVNIMHKNVINFIHGINAAIDFQAGKAILALTTVSFDIFVLETLLPLVKGLKVVIATEEQQKDPQLLANKILKDNLNMLQVTPSSLKLLIDGDVDLICLKNVEIMMIGGESFPGNLFERLKVDYKGHIYNMYGPAETTVWSTIKNLTASEKITIGNPIINTQIYIIDRYDKLQPRGVTGELCIGGEGVASGYLNSPELTAEKFDHYLWYCRGEEKKANKKAKKLPKKAPDKNRKNHMQSCNHAAMQPYNRATMQLSPHHSPHYPITPLPHSTIYRTGDLARWLQNGDIEFLGRIDQQVKIRGFRIELGEIESQLLTHEEIRNVVVVLKTDENGDKYLCAYVVADKKCSISELRVFLSEKLPDYMIPAYFINLDHIPLTTNGKVDHQALLKTEGSLLKTGTTYVEPKSEIEKIIYKTWKEVLKLDKVGIDDNFLDLGGTSLKVILVVRQLENILKKDMPVVTLFRFPTIRSLANFLSQQNSISTTRDRTSIKAKGRERLKQKRILRNI